MNTNSEKRCRWSAMALFLGASLATGAALAPPAEAAVSFNGKKITFIC